jgi:hypothetical protein
VAPSECTRGDQTRRPAFLRRRRPPHPEPFVGDEGVLRARAPQGAFPARHGAALLEPGPQLQPGVSRLGRDRPQNTIGSLRLAYRRIASQSNPQPVEARRQAQLATRRRPGGTMVRYLPGPQSCCSTQVQSAIHPRPSSHRRQAVWLPVHHRPPCSTSTGRGGSNRRSSTRCTTFTRYSYPHAGRALGGLAQSCDISRRSRVLTGSVGDPDRRVHVLGQDGAAVRAL